MNLFIKTLRKYFLKSFNVLNIPLEFSPIPKQDKYRVKLLKLLNIDLVIDVGANIGQYSLGLFKNGYTGNIISFEPVGDAHLKLVEQSKKYDKWLVYEKCAIGDNEGEIEINVSKNFESSSILNVLEKSIVAEPTTSFIRKEKVKIHKLSNIDVIRKYNKIHLKIDVQGYEEMVLNGAVDVFSKVLSLQLEISLVPLYSGALLPEVLLVKLKEYGFVPVCYTSAFTHPIIGTIMQLDGLFVKRELLTLIPEE